MNVSVTSWRRLPSRFSTLLLWGLGWGGLVLLCLFMDAGCEDDDVPSGWDKNEEGYVRHFEPLIRLGDDQNYNAHHSDHFVESTPQGTSYAVKFEAPGSSEYQQAQIRYDCAGASQPNDFILNDQTVGHTESEGNRADSRRTCTPIPITGVLHSGSNVLRIELRKYPGDTVTPLDDIEIYDLRIQLIR